MYVAMHDFSSFLEIKIINAVSDFYKESSLKFEEHPHVIAALIIEKDGMYCPVILSGGTKYSTKSGIIACSEADYWNICDGHAEAICYRLSVLYIAKEIINLKNKKSSIFELSEDQCKFKLKETIKFHLLISKRPCGFMAKKTSIFLSWKRPLHILECSSKILIGSFLGIQGPLSCLLSKPVHISSILILEDLKIQCTKEQEVKPDLSDIKKHFHKFHEKLNEYNADKNMSLLPDVTICKVNLQKCFKNLATKVKHKKCHLVFDKAIFGEKSNFSTTQEFCVEDENIGTKIIQLSQIEFPSSPRSCVESCPLNSFLKAFKICNESLEINEAVKQAKADAEEYVERLENKKKDNESKLKTQLYLQSSISKYSKQMMIDQYPHKSEKKELEYELKNESEKKELEYKLKKLTNVISSHKKQIDDASVIVDYYRKQLEKNTFKCLTEVDCDWVKYMSILHNCVV